MLERFLLRPILTFLLKLFFSVEVKGMEHYHAAGDRVVVIANHVSFIDPLVIAVFLPEKPAFAINIFQAEKWYFKWLDALVTLYRLDPSKPISMKRMIQDLRASAKRSAKVVIFPEGRISTSGGIMKVYEGTGLIIQKTGATVLPIRIDGAEYSKLSRLGTKLRQRWFPKIRMTILPPQQCDPGDAVSTDVIYNLMTDAAFAASDYQRSLLDVILDSYKWHGGAHVIAADMARNDMGYRQLFTRSFILSEKLSRTLEEQTYIGVMLPSAIGAMVTFISLHMLGKIPCMLNFSSGEANIRHACDIACVKTILTSRTFIEKAKLESVIEALQEDHTLIYLEDIRPSVTLADKITGFLNALRARTVLHEMLAGTKPDSPAVILYTSGSEGVPKGVALSHANILANISQASARLDLTTSDKLFNALPVFHSFGLTVGMLLPLVRGIKTFLYPTPLHYRIIPDLVYDTDATIMLGTDTFYNGYAHYAHPYDFWNIRLAVAGAEKLRETTRRLYNDKFCINIFEGYGVTESGPVLAVNTPLQYKAGTVGRPLPGISCRIEKVDGLEDGGRLLVQGPNVMLGYLKGDNPGIIIPQEVWYDTGDIVSIDEQGFIRIIGRAKRFAKIAGEMVSLVAVEELASNLISGVTHAAIAMPDERKGEQILLFTESHDLTKEQLIQQARVMGVAEICLPKHVVHITTIPRLGSGKIDYVALSKRLITAQ